MKALCQESSNDKVLLMAEERIFKALAFKIIFYEQFLTRVVWEVFCRVEAELIVMQTEFCDV